MDLGWVVISARVTEVLQHSFFQNGILKIQTHKIKQRTGPFWRAKNYKNNASHNFDSSTCVFQPNNQFIRINSCTSQHWRFANDWMSWWKKFSLDITRNKARKEIFKSQPMSTRHGLFQITDHAFFSPVVWFSSVKIITTTQTFLKYLQVNGCIQVVDTAFWLLWQILSIGTSQ